MAEVSSGAAGAGPSGDGGGPAVEVDATVRASFARYGKDDDFYAQHGWKHGRVRDALGLPHYRPQALAMARELLQARVKAARTDGSGKAGVDGWQEAVLAALASAEGGDGEDGAAGGDGAAAAGPLVAIEGESALLKRLASELTDILRRSPVVDWSLFHNKVPHPAPRPSGLSCLLEPAMFGCSMEMRELLRLTGDAKALVNMAVTAAGDNITPLMLCSMNGHSSCLQILLSVGANVNARVAGTGLTALMLATAFGQLDCVYHLVRAGADVDAFDAAGYTALLYAMDGGRLARYWEENPRDAFFAKLAPFALRRARQYSFNECAAELLDAGASPSVSSTSRLGGNRAGATPMGLATWRQNSKSIVLLLEYGSYLSRAADTRLDPLLEEAAKLGYWFATRALIAAGARTSPAVLAAARAAGEELPAAALTPAAAAPAGGGGGGGKEERKRDEDGGGGDGGGGDGGAASGAEDALTAALIDAASLGQHDQLVRLLGEGCLADGSGSQRGATALHWACRYGHGSCMLTLLEAGAPLDGGDRYGWTPLMYACFGGHLQLIVTLVRRGAKLEAAATAEALLDNCRLIEGAKAIDICARRAQLECTAALLQLGADMPRRTPHNRFYTCLAAALPLTQRHAIQALVDRLGLREIMNTLTPRLARYGTVEGGEADDWGRLLGVEDELPALPVVEALPPPSAAAAAAAVAPAGTMAAMAALGLPAGATGGAALPMGSTPAAAASGAAVGGAAAMPSAAALFMPAHGGGFAAFSAMPSGYPSPFAGHYAMPAAAAAPAPAAAHAAMHAGAGAAAAGAAAAGAAPGSAPLFCATCGRGADQQCSGCHRVVYCDGACQLADWPRHKVECTAFA
eukprot:PLAT6449.1.p1 GENE.PLAT6449.1~~PLAT6449.1.p1  ORF type:complete len:861 (+),score=440.00 PLAT6449.1:55-2637(+)